MASWRAFLPRIASLLTSLVLVGGCDRADSNGMAAPGPRVSAPPAATVYTTFYPTTYFAQRIGGEAVQVCCPAPDDADPADWQPDSATLVRYQGAGLIVFNGADFEAWRKNASLPESRVVDAAAPLAAEFIRFKAQTHSHGARGEHVHQGVDGHVWMDPVSAKRQAGEIARAMGRQWPGRAKGFDANVETLGRDLEALGLRLKVLTPSLSGVRLIASHPAYHYLARRYGWPVADVDLPPEADPDGARWAELLAAAGDGPAIVLFESQPCPALLARLSSRPAIRAVVFETCETPDPSGNYLERMNRNIDRLSAAARGGQ